ncbi:MAG: tetratricopeptide repeat protein, partial [Planctomycetota bacterium]
LSFAYWVPTIWGYAPPGESFRKAKSAANKAMALDETLAIAHRAVGWIALAYDWDWKKAKESFERARELSPNDPFVYHNLAWYFVVAGRLDDAVDAYQTALKLDPLSLLYNTCLGDIYALSRQFEQAAEQYEKTLELGPNYLRAIISLADYYMAMSMYPEAVTTIERAMTLAGRTPFLVAMLGRAYALSGRKDEAETLLQELQERATSEYVLPIFFAEVYASLGNTDEAFRWLEKCFEERSLPLLRYDWSWDPLRDDPRFDDLVQRMNFPEAPDSGVVSEPIEAAQAPIEKIAVLPFTSISSEADEDWLVDGMTEMLSIRLGQIKALTVISSRSAMQFKGVSKPMREIARELGVEGLIEGTVIRVRDDVQITAGLIDGRIDKRIWGDVFQGTFSNILALQSEVTLAIAREIEVALTPEEELRIADTKPINPEAYEAFLKGRLFFDKFTAESLKTAAVYLQQAIDMKPDYAEAHALLASAYWVPSIWGYSRPHESFAKAKRAASTAMTLDDTDAQTHVAVGWIALAYDWEWQKAKESFERAIKFNPSYADGYLGLACYLMVAGRFDEAIETTQTAVKLDPLSHSSNNALANVYSYAGQVERAIEQRKKTLELYPDYLDARDNLAYDYLSISMYPEAVATIERGMSLAGRTPELVTRLARAYALSGRRDEADTLLQELHERATSEYVLPRYFAEVYASLGNTDEALKWLEKGYEERDWSMLLLKTWSVWDSLRSNAKFENLVQRMGFPE